MIRKPGKDPEITIPRYSSQDHKLEKYSTLGRIEQITTNIKDIERGRAGGLISFPFN